MYKTAYAQEASTSAKTLRSGERLVFQESIDLLERAEASDGDALAATEAIVFARRLWTVLMEDLSREENSLSEQLRASIISVGLWVLRECEDIKSGRSNNFRGLIEVTTSIRDGLK